MHSSRDRVLDLEAGVQLDERERAVRAEQELERARVDVADRAAGALGRGLHLLAQLGRERGRRRLLDQLLVAALDRALALAEREHVAVRVAEHLDLDVPRGRQHLLDVERRVAERRLGLGRRGAERVLEIGRRLDEPHALAAAARRRLEQHRVADLRRGRARGLDRRRALRPGHGRHAGRLHRLPRRDLVAHLRPSLPPAARRRRGRCRRTPRRTRGSRPGSRSRDARPGSRS